MAITLALTARAAFKAGAAATVGAALTATGANANVGDAYGLGSRNSALAGTGVASSFDGFAAYSNPAALPLALAGGKRFALDFGVLYMDPLFQPIRNVVTSNDFVADTLNASGTVDTSYRSTLGQTMGAATSLFSALNLTAGLATFLPLNQLAYLDTGETYHPEYVLYRARTQRPQIEAALGADLSPKVHVGAGLHIGFSLTNNATVFISSINKPSSMRFISSLKAKVSPFFGALWTPSPDFALGAVLRLPMTSGNHMTLKTATRVGGLGGAFDFNFLATSAFFYDPPAAELGAQLQHSEHARTIAQLDFQAWRSFEYPALRIESCTEGAPPCGVNVTSSLNPGFSLRNVLIPRLAEELTWGPTSLRFGYGYRPGIFSAPPSGAGNYLDPSKHMFTLGAGRQMEHFRVDAHFAYHQLLTEHVVKSPGYENGTGSGDLKVGAPRYDAGGKILGGGVSLSWRF
ncbi:MAG: hypothetical protein NDJ90_15210 [Oligoflexia bacterium]|nr:hypothetical protein [Oligoflexia bacterium]